MLSVYKYRFVCLCASGRAVKPGGQRNRQTATNLETDRESESLPKTSTAKKYLHKCEVATANGQRLLLPVFTLRFFSSCFLSPFVLVLRSIQTLE